MLLFQPRKRHRVGDVHNDIFEYILRPIRVQVPALPMLEHLIDEVKFTPDVLDAPEGRLVSKATPQEVVDAQIETAKWLEELGCADDNDVFDQIQENNARDAFAAMVANTTPEQQKTQLVRINTPQAVKHLVGMLTAYDWHFVEQAKEIRGYAVAQLVEETKHPDAKIRLKALELLGKVTEVALFTERVEVKKTEMTDAELENRIKDKLERMAKIIDVTDVTEVEVKPVGETHEPDKTGD